MATKTKDIDIIPDVSTDIANIDAEIAAEAENLVAGLHTGQDKISTMNKQYRLPDGTVLGPVMEAVILGYTDSSSFYENEAFNKDNIQEPICFADAIGDAIKKPAASVEKPFAENCKDCEWNVFGSSTISEKGKRCKEEFRAMLLPKGCKEPLLLTIPPTARKAFGKTIQSIVKAFGHPVKAVARFEFNEHVQFSQPVITDAAPNPDYPKHYILSKDAMADLPRK